MQRIFFRIFFLVLAALAASGEANNTPLPFVSPMFGDNMVLQRGKLIRLWGWAKAGDVIHVDLGGHATTAVAGDDGRWQTVIKAPAPGGPYVVTHQ